MNNQFEIELNRNCVARSSRLFACGRPYPSILTNDECACVRSYACAHLMCTNLNTEQKMKDHFTCFALIISRLKRFFLFSINRISFFLDFYHIFNF